MTPIPEDQFITNTFTDTVGRCCAIGHVIRLKSKNPNDYRYDNCSDDHFGSLRSASKTYLYNTHGADKSIAAVNNHDNINGYAEPVIKDRVIHLLNGMVAAGY